MPAGSAFLFPFVSASVKPGKEYILFHYTILSAALFSLVPEAAPVYMYGQNTLSQMPYNCAGSLHRKDRIHPVSYTHLDVYKRQLLDCVKFWIQEFDIDGLRLDVAYSLDHDFMKSLRRYLSLIHI